MDYDSKCVDGCQKYIYEPKFWLGLWVWTFSGIILNLGWLARFFGHLSNCGSLWRPLGQKNTSEVFLCLYILLVLDSQLSHL